MSEEMLEPATFAQGFREAVADSPNFPALKTLDESVQLTYRELAARVDAMAGGLEKLGLRKGDTVALMTSNRPEFHIADLAAVTLGSVPFSIYQTLAPEQIAYVVGNSGARIAIVEAPFLEGFLEARRELPDLEKLVVLGAEGGDLTFEALEAMGDGFDGAAAAARVQPSDLLTLIYTSGTTGPPKGVQLTHANLAAAASMLKRASPLPANGRVASWLPTAHIAERALNYYLPILCRSTITTIPDPRQIIAALPSIRPDFFFAVPRIWEKTKAGLEARLAAAPENQRKAMAAALEEAREKLLLEQAGKSVPRRSRGPGRGARPESLRANPRPPRTRPRSLCQRRRRPHTTRCPRVLPRHRHPPGRRLGHVGDHRDRHPLPPRRSTDWHRRQARPRLRNSPRGGR